MVWRIFLIGLILITTACQTEDKTKSDLPGSSQEKTAQFDSEKWKVKDGQDYPYRDEMVDEIMDSRLLKPLNRDSIITLLGQPDRTDGNYLFYTVRQKRMGMWPLHTKTLVIRLFPDSTENAILIHE